MGPENNHSNKYHLARPAYYFYHKKIIRQLFSVIDLIGYKFFTPKPLITNSSNKILMINLGGAGDLIISEPLLSTLSDFSNKKIDLICFPGQEKALLDLPCLGKIFYFELPWLGGKKGKWKSFIGLFSLIKSLRKEKYSVAIDIKGDPIIILVMLFSKIPFRVGFSNGGLGFLLTHPFSQPENLKRFKIDLFIAQAFEKIDINYNRPPILSPILPPNSLIKNQTNIVVHLGATTQSRSWPLIYWAELLEMLNKNYHIEIVGSPNNVKSLFNLAPKLINLCIDSSGKSWLETAKIIKNSDIFIGANSGPAHLAAALGCPVISIFSAANDPDVWAPPNAEVIIFKPDCFNCELNYCSDLSCLKKITPKIVNGYVLKIIKNNQV